MLFNVLLAVAAAAPVVVAVPNLMARDAPAVIYPGATSVWQPNQRHNVTWASTSGTASSIQMKQGDKTTTLASNVDLSSGRTEITVPGSLSPANDYAIEIVVGGETATGAAFAVATTPAGVTSAAGSASSAVSSAASAGSSIVSSAESAASSVVASVSSAAASGASAASSSVASITSSVGESASSVGSSIDASASSVAASISSAVSAGHSSASSVLSGALSSATNPTNSASASATGNAASRADLGVSGLGVVVAAGLVVISTVSGALLF